MKLPCNVILDLLPLYCDQVCSPETQELVEEHLAECSSCTMALRSLKEELPVPKQDIESTNILKNIKKELHTKEIKWTLIVVGILIIYMFAEFFLTSRFVPVSTDDMNITQVSYSADGIIGFHLTMLNDEDFEFATVEYSPEDGALYIAPHSTIIDSVHDEDQDYFYYNPNNSSVYTYPHWATIDGPVKQIYIGTAKDSSLVWEEGMSLPDWPPFMEDDYLTEALKQDFVE